MSHKEGGIQFALPAGWQSDADGDRLLIHSPDNSVAIVFFVATEDNFEADVGVMGFAEPASWKKNEAAYNKLIESIRKTK